MTGKGSVHEDFAGRGAAERNRRLNVPEWAPENESMVGCERRHAAHKFPRLVGLVRAGGPVPTLAAEMPS